MHVAYASPIHQGLVEPAQVSEASPSKLTNGKTMLFELRNHFLQIDMVLLNFAVIYIVDSSHANQLTAAFIHSKPKQMQASILKLTLFMVHNDF